MVVSHGSTFGYVAHGRVGRPPLLVTPTGSCVRSADLRTRPLQPIA